MDKLDQATEQLFGEALELRGEERRAFLDRACEGEPALRSRVESLLEDHDRLGGFLSESPLCPTPRKSHGLPQGARIGRYTVVALLGAGGMGEVYHGRDTSLGRDVAIKVLQPGLASVAGYVTRFQREARALAALNHPNICTIYEIGEQDGLIFIAMEFLQGCDLRQLIRQKPMEPDAAVAIATQIADALDTAHSAGIVHRDIKPANLFLTNREQVKILDFGIARASAPGGGSAAATETNDCVTQPGEAMGTVEYMSPEQVRGQNVDPRTDLFSFGVVLYEMLTGVLPFRGASQGLIFEAILNRAPVPLRDLNRGVPALLEEIVQKALEKERDLRYQHASEMRADLMRLRRDTESSRHAAATVAPRPALQISVWMWPLAGVAGLTAAWFLRPVLPPPTVTATTQLTHDTDGKGVGDFAAYSISTDGTRVYYNGDVNGSKTLHQVSTSGGATVAVPVPSGFDYLTDFSVARSEVLFAREPNKDGDPALWVQPLPGGDARRVGDLDALDATWSSDGKSIYLSSATNSVAMADSDGSHLRRLFDTDGYTFFFRVSPDGRAVRFSVYNEGTNSLTLWEMRPDGSNLHRLFADWQGAQDPCCGVWTPDGKYFVFVARRNDLPSLWAIRETPDLWHKVDRRPVQLSQGLIRADAPTISPDGRKVFFIGTTPRGELVRYDSKSRKSQPILPNISTDSASYSPDGKKLAYISYPERILWECAADGSDPHQLTFNPMGAGLARWSPDGQSIAFSADIHGQPEHIDVVSAGGGDVRQVSPRDVEASDPSWSPDGKSIAYWASAKAGEDSLYTVDVVTGQATPIPHSSGKISPRWSPDGGQLAAMTGDTLNLMLYDFSTRRWSALVTHHPMAYPSWSQDSKCIYFQTDGPYFPIDRVCLRDRKVQHVGDLMPDGSPVSGHFGGWSGLGPGDSLLAARDLSSQEIYSLDVHFP